EKQKARDAEVLELAQDDLKLRQLAFVGLADHDGGIHRRDRGAHVVREFDRAGTIDEGIFVPHETGGGGGETDAHLVVARLGAGVADGSSGIDAAGFGNGASARQDGFKKCGFSALKRAHQCNTPWTAGTSDVLSHCRLLVWSSALDWVGGVNGPSPAAIWQEGKKSLQCKLMQSPRRHQSTGRRAPNRRAFRRSESTGIFSVRTTRACPPLLRLRRARARCAD